MLAIRMQRTGRKGHAQFRLIVQDSHRSPKSGNIVFALGSYDPHSKQVTVDKEKAAFYLEHGAQPSSRVAVLLKNEGVKLPKWVKIDSTKQSGVRNAEKRRSTAPAAPVEEAAEEPAAEEAPAENAEAPEPAETEAKAEEPAPEAKTEEEASEEN